jgi:hypothetical protein
MTSTSIYTILSSKPHNQHYLNRYIKFISNYVNQPPIKYKTQKHHICPKANDLFPEYASFKSNKWNAVNLTHRQHYIAHYLLAKTYKGSQIFAFWAMCNKQSPKDSRKRTYNVHSKIYENFKIEFSQNCSTSTKGKAAYIDNNGAIFYCSVTDPRVVSKEFVSMSTGRTYKPRTETSKELTSTSLKCYHSKTTKIKLYYEQNEIEVFKYSDEYERLLFDGWTITKSKQILSDIVTKIWANRSNEHKKRIGAKISATRKSKKYPAVVLTPEKRKRLRRYKEKNYSTLFYNILSNQFEMIDPLDINAHHIQPFVSRNIGIRKYDINGKFKFVNKMCPNPPGYFDYDPTKNKCIIVYHTQLKSLLDIHPNDYDDTIHVKLFTPNGNRIKFYRIDKNINIYLDKNFVKEYGIPINCQ